MNELFVDNFAGGGGASTGIDIERQGEKLMTNADHIRQMNDEELVKLLVWRSLESYDFLPSCDYGCIYLKAGCGLDCPPKRREQAIRKWLKEERVNK